MMQIDEIIAAVDSLEPNQYDKETKLQWLSELDGKIFQEVILTHEKPAARLMDRAVVDTDNEELIYPAYETGNEQPIAGAPYGKDMYCYYLQAMIALHNMETAKYNQRMLSYNNAFTEFSSWYNRNHYPKQQRGGTRFRF